MNRENHISDEVKGLIAGHLSDSLNADDLAKLKAWIDESADNKSYFNEMRHAWALSGDDISGGEKEKNMVELAEKLSRRNAGRRLQPFWTWQRIAASWVIIIIGAGAAGWFMRNEQSIAEMHITMIPTVTTVYAKSGSQSSVDMPDGTKIWLNGGSKLTYNDTYGARDREVQLTGEACFEVVTDPEKPFTVKAGGLSIKALGTTFNVKAYPEDKAVTATLVKGRIVVEGKDGNDKTFSIAMKPNENVTYRPEMRAPTEPSLPDEPGTASATDSNTPEKQPIVVENNIKTELYTSWKDDLWIIEKQKLGNLSKDFERRYNVQIVFSSDNIKNYHFTGSIRREPVEQVMKILRRTIPLKYSFEKDVIIIGEDKQLYEEFILKNQ